MVFLVKFSFSTSCIYDLHLIIFLAVYFMQCDDLCSNGRFAFLSLDSDMVVVVVLVKGWGTGGEE